MALTKSTDLTHSAVVNYQKEAMIYAAGEEVWGQFVDWEAPIPNDGGNAASYDYLAYGELDPALTALTEDADVTPQVLTDYNVTLTPTEYGNAVGRTQLAAFKSRAKTQAAFGKIIGLNRTRSVDRLLRNGILANTQVMYAGSATARTGLDTTNDLPTYDWLTNLVATAENMGMEPQDGTNYVSIINPQTARELMKLTEFRSPRYYLGSDVGGDLYKGEIGLLAGIRFIKNRFGKVYLSGGTVAQAATTLNGAVSAGATTIILTSGTGVAVGDYLTIGTLESNTAEQVQVTNIDATPTIVVKGVGQGPSGFGLRFDHANLAAVTEAVNVGAIPLLGRNSIKGVYGQRTGQYGEFDITQGLDIMRRFVYFWWYWFGGLGIVERYVIRGECAITGGVIGYN